MNNRKGIALVLVLGLLLVAGSFGYILRQLTQASYREIDTLKDHLAAVPRLPGQ